MVYRSIIRQFAALCGTQSHRKRFRVVDSLEASVALRSVWFTVSVAVFQILSIDSSYRGGLTVGMTACDPSALRPSDLPDDSDHLLDRLEYWVVHKEVLATAEVEDEISITLTNDGK